MNDIKRPWGILEGIRPVKLARKLLKTEKSVNAAVDAFVREYGADIGKAELAVKIASIENPLIDNMLQNGVSVYIGIPFCPTRCLYCSFVSNSGAKSAKLIPDYLECLYREIEYTAQLLKAMNKTVETVYIGGGTPTTLDEYQLNSLFEKIFTSFDLSQIKEFTVEAGRPDTVTKEKLITINSWGVDRISINPQSMNQKTLEVIFSAST